MEFLRQLRDGIMDAWRKLSLSARVNIIMAGVVAVVLVAVVAFNSAQPQYVILSTGLEPATTKRITEMLDAQRVPYRIEDENKTITVPLQHRSRMQLLLADSNLPVGRSVAPGFELFQESELMTNQWLQNVKFMRAVQGELQRQLNAFDFVEYSHVLIREAKEELFVSDQKPSEAAVTLKTTRPLTKQEIKAVVSIIDQAGGPNLHTGNITLTTTSGEVLWMPAQSEYAAIANSKLEYVAELEQRQERRILATLQDMNVRGTVRVSAQVDFSQKEITDEAIKEGTEVSTYTTTTTSSSRESLPEGAPGAVANIPEGTAGPGGVNTIEETSEEIANYEPSRTVTRTKIDPGNVVKYNVALVVEGRYETATGDDGAETRSYVGLTDTERDKFEAIVKGAVGAGGEDTVVTIHDHPFDVGMLAATTAAIQSIEAEEFRAWRNQMIWYGVQLALILFGGLLVYVMLRRTVAMPEAEEEEEEVREIPEATREDMRRQEIANEIARLAIAEPDSVAALLRSWMMEQEEE